MKQQVCAQIPTKTQRFPGVRKQNRKCSKYKRSL